MPITVEPVKSSHNILICLGGYAITCFLCVLYAAINGNALQVTYGDTWIYTDLAKRIFFNHSLRMDVVFDLIYPPLYPALISIAYVFKSQGAIFHAITALNILVYSSAFIPIYLLFRNYSQLNKVQAFCGAVLSVISPWPLSYVIYPGAEALYYPLAAWFTWLLVDGVYLRGRFGFAAFIAVFAALPLTKAIGNTVLPAFILFSVAIYYFAGRPRPIKLISRPLIAIFAFALIMYLYKRYQGSVLPQVADVTGGYLSQLSHPNLFKLSYWIERTRMDLSWVIRGTKTAALPMLITIFARNRQLLFKDPLMVFASLIFAGMFVVIPLFTPGDPLLSEYPRYLASFVFVFVVIVLKYHRLLTTRDLFIAAGILSAGILIGLHPGPLQEPIRWHIGAFYCMYFGCLLYWRKDFVNVFLISMCVTTLVFCYDRRIRPSETDGSIVSFYDQHGITQRLLELRKTYPAAPVLVDKSWRGQNLETWIEYERNMINMPFLPVFVDVDALMGDRKDHGAPALLLTHSSVKHGKKEAQGKRIALYLLGGKTK